MSVALLRETGLGKLLTKLKKQFDEKNLALCDEIMTAWKHAVGIGSNSSTSPVAKSSSSHTINITLDSNQTNHQHDNTNGTHTPSGTASTSLFASSSITSHDIALKYPNLSAESILLQERESRKRKAEAEAEQNTHDTKKLAAPTTLNNKLSPPPSTSSASLSIRSASHPLMPYSSLPTYQAVMKANSTNTDNIRHHGGTKIFQSDQLRNKICTMIYNALISTEGKDEDAGGNTDIKTGENQDGIVSNGPSASLKKDAEKYTVEIEQHIYDCTGRDSNKSTYRTKAREICMNLNDTKNPELKQSILNGELTTLQLVTLPFRELASQALKLERDASHKWEMLERRSDNPFEHKIETTDQWRCGKCKERKCTYYQMQTRSADEPMTTFVRCVNCGNRWRC